MITNGLLWVALPELLEERIGGLSVLERQLFTAARAGLKRLWIAAPQPAAKTLKALRLPQGLDLRWIAKDSDAPVDCEPPYIGLSSDHFLRVDALRGVLAQEHRNHIALQGPEGDVALQVLPFRWDRSVAYRKEPLPAGSSVRLRLPLAKAAVLPWLLNTGPKSADGFMARHFDRHLSLGVSRLLLETSVTPNGMTVLSCLIGLIGTAFFLRHDWASAMTGAVLVWLHSVLDGCDGELARIRFQESPLGAAIDFWGDNLVHLSLFACLAGGFYLADNSLVPVALGAAACAGTIGSATVAYRQKLEGRGPLGAAPSQSQPLLARLETILAQRDFIYLLVFLAYIGKTYEFLWASAVGSLLFFAALMSLSGTAPRPAQAWSGTDAAEEKLIASRRFQREQA